MLSGEREFVGRTNSSGLKKFLRGIAARGTGGCNAARGDGPGVRGEGICLGRFQGGPGVMDGENQLNSLAGLGYPTLIESRAV